MVITQDTILNLLFRPFYFVVIIAVNVHIVVEFCDCRFPFVILFRHFLQSFLNFIQRSWLEDQLYFHCLIRHHFQVKLRLFIALQSVRQNPFCHFLCAFILGLIILRVGDKILIWGICRDLRLFCLDITEPDREREEKIRRIDLETNRHASIHLNRFRFSLQQIYVELTRVEQSLQVVVCHFELQVHIRQQLLGHVVSRRNNYLSWFADLVGGYIR